MTAPYYVGLDVGGTTMKAGVVDETGRPLAAAVSLPTEPSRGQDVGLAQMAATIRLAVASAGLTVNQLAAIGVAVPGLIDIPAGILLDPINLRPWRDVPVRRYLADLFGLPTAFQNDANAAAYGEYWAGAGRSARSLVMFTLGTGVGGGIVLESDAGRRGTVLHGEHSHAAELGHMLVQAGNGRPCGCGRHGCLEAYASATAVVKRTLAALALDDGRSTLHRELRDRGELTARAVFDAGETDALANQVVEETAFYLAVGATNLMHCIDPDVVVFGGGMIAAGPAFLERIRQHVGKLAFPILAERTRVCYAELGTDAGFIGAAGCGRLLVQK
jgi:glucokinase